MYEMTISVTVNSLNEGKKDSGVLGYAEFFIPGGKINLRVNKKEHYKILSENIGKTLDCVFRNDVDNTLRFKRNILCFIPVEIIELELV